ncbi:hypothetical protein KIW84_052432 [Lathyrus oleraceus]|uniref:Uncharacterized protein n=1 Tax=Pisum sativum TaxID=3888 RepID=A0A9D5AF89_PEA|nr:hypothetical protein KIW84_052432 [Pisum sativum]
MSRPPILIVDLKHEQNIWKLVIRSVTTNSSFFINSGTVITVIDIQDSPYHSFDFKPFGDFLNGVFDVDRLYDVIGVVQQIQRTQVAGSGKNPCVNLTLSDEWFQDGRPSPTASQALSLSSGSHGAFEDKSFSFVKDVNTIGEMICLKDTNEDHPKIYPAHIDNLIDKHFSFCVKYQPYYSQASVVKLTEDPQVIQMLKDAMSPTVLRFQNSLSAAQNWSPGHSFNNTSSKRLSRNGSSDEPRSSYFLTPKLSTTKTSKPKSARPSKNK